MRLERVPAEMLVLLLHLAEPGENPIHVIALCRVRHLVLQRLELVVQVSDTTAPGDRLIEDGAACHFLDVLAEVADGRPLRDRNLPLVGRFLAGDHPEDGRLPGAVRADEADLLARIELERRVDEQDLPAVLLADAGEGDHPDRAYHVARGSLQAPF